MLGQRVFLCQHSPTGFPEAEEGGGGTKKRRCVSVSRRMRWKIGRPFDNETASCSTPKAAQAAGSSQPGNFVEGEGGGRGE